MIKAKNIKFGLYPRAWMVAAGGGFIVERRDGRFSLQYEIMEGDEVVSTRKTTIGEATFKILRKEAKGNFKMMDDVVKKGEVKP
jgi:hypothetical protein